jgi:zinc protease
MEEAVAVAAGAWYQSTAVDRSRLLVYAVPRPGITLDALEARVLAVIDEMSKHPVDENELRRAKTRLVADAIYAQDSQSSLARMYGSALATGSTVEDVKSWPDMIEAVDAASVQRAAATWLHPHRMVTGYLLKDEAA